MASCDTLNSSSYEKKREDLADKLGVEIQDYPDESMFPLGYFDVTLESGMTLNEIHEIVQGYEKVLHCRTYSEIYYYFSTEDDKALRFEITYDEQMRLRRYQEEEIDSRTITTNGCDNGQIPEK
jgi:hypothetical protein